MHQWITCPQCGWQSEPTAIMCGGCGQPLRAPGALAAVGHGAPDGAEPAPASDLPTLYDVPSPHTSGAPALDAPAQPAVPASRTALRPRARGCLVSGLLSLAALALIAAGLWTLLIRPPLHAQADGLIGRGLDQAVARVPALEDDDLQVHGPTFQATQSDINAALQQALPSGSGLDSVSVAFRSGAVLVNYSAYGTSGTVQTTLRVRGGQLVATQTQVSGPLGWMESGDELQGTINQGLARLGSKTPHGFNSVSVGGDTITLVLNTAG